MLYDHYDFESRYQVVDGYRIHYVDEGKGETLLMVHGNPTWSYLYRHFIRDLRSDYRCIALDHLGFGYSDKPWLADYSMRAHIMRLKSFVDQLGLKDITFVGQDWGGIIGLGWAVYHKHLVKRLVILNTAGFAPVFREMAKRKGPVPWAFPMLWALKIPILGEIFVQGLNGFAKYLIPLATYHRERLTPEVMRGYLEPYPTWGSRRAHLKSVRQIPMLPTHPTWQLLRDIGMNLRGWPVPTQIIWGMKDPVFVPWFADKFEELLPNHRPTLRIPDASHFLQDDTPAPIIAKIREFLSSAELAASRQS
jgi:haloalkane dehalogenase